MRIGQADVTQRKQQIGNLDRQVTRDTAEIASANQELGAASQELSAAYSAHAAKPTKAGAERIASATAKLEAAKQRVDTAVKSTKTDSAALESAQAQLLDVEKRYNTMNPYGEKWDVASRFDDVKDAASLSRDEQVKLFGAPVRIGTSAALDKDVKLIAAASSPTNKAQMLAMQLEGAEAGYGDKLVSKLSDADLQKMAAAANGSPEAADALLKVAGQLSGPQRERVAAALASNIESTVFEPSQITSGLAKMMKSGDGFELSADLLGKAKGDGANELKFVTAAAMQSLRTDFESKKEKVENNEAHLASLSSGFAKTLTPEQMQSGVVAFKKRHEGDDKAMNAAAAKYMNAVKVAGRMPALSKADHAELTEKLDAAKKAFHIEVPFEKFSPSQQLDLELTRAAKGLDELKDTEPGQKAIDKALTEPHSWLHELSEKAEKTGGALEVFTDKVQKAVGQSIGRAALLGNDATMMQKLRDNAGLLGIDDKALHEFEEISKDLKGADPKKAQAALDKLETGNYGKGLKVLGLALALPGALKTLSGGNDGTLNKIKGYAELGKFGADLMTLVSDSGVIKHLAESIKGPAEVVVGAVQVIQGLGQLFGGDKIAGASNLLSGAGGLIMSVAMFAEAVPGGQLAGVALMVAGQVVGAFVETESEKAEKAAQKDGAAFLKGAGIKEDLAVALTNLRESDHKNIGPFLDAYSKYLGISQQQLIAKLDTMDKDDLHVFTDMALNLPSSKDGKFNAEKTEWNDVPFPTSNKDGWSGPRSFETLTQYGRKYLDLPV